MDLGIQMLESLIETVEDTNFQTNIIQKLPFNTCKWKECLQKPSHYVVKETGQILTANNKLKRFQKI